MEQAVEAIRYITNAFFVALAVYCFLRWRSRGGSANAWLAVTFGVLGTIGLLGLLLPESAQESDWITKLQVLIILVFPYALYRFMATLAPRPRAVDRLAIGLTLLVAAGTLILPDIPEQGEPRDLFFSLFVLAFLIQWSVLLLIVAATLWRAGRGQPTLIRRRMRLLSLGSILMTVVLLIAGAAPQEGATNQLVTQLLALSSVVLFFVGFAPPAFVRAAWRHREQAVFYEGAEQLVSATSEAEVSQAVLPHVARIVGARAAALRDPQNRVIGSVGEADPGIEGEVITLESSLSTLQVWTSPYTPFFGQEELDLLRSLNVMASLALERAALFTSEQDARHRLASANAELAEAIEDLTFSESRLAEAQATAHIGSWEWTLGDDRVVWSNEMYRMLGLDPAAYVPSVAGFTSFVHPDDRERVTELLNSSIAEGEPFETDFRIVRADGSTRVMHARGQVDLNDKSNAIRLNGTLQDVTELRRVERELGQALDRQTESRQAVEALNKEMETFLYTVSHDLNGPLVSMVGFLDFLEKDYEDVLDERGKFYIERMDASARYMQALIRDLLQLSRVGRVETEPEEVDLGKLVADVAAEVRSSYPNLTVTAEDLPPVHANAVRTRQLFANLFQNAAKYSKSDDPRVLVSALNNGSMVEISVHDSGPGIPPDHRQRVFGVFERLEQRDDEGTGMGLAICRKIVENNGGEIWIADSEEGADIRFTLPPAGGHGVASLQPEVTADA